MRVAVLVLEGAFDTGLATVLDTLDTANALADRKSARFGVSVIGFAQRVRTSQGFVVKLRPAASAKRPDVVIVPALGAKTPETILARIGRPDVASAGALLRKWRSGGARVAAACTGTFVLAASGLLDGRRA
ncbi:MAG TPA: DJ-1/PfpI family protein, partial [Polyangiaceae bacterium]